MGFPIQNLLCASNSNNILTDFMHTGIYNPSGYTLKVMVDRPIRIANFQFKSDVLLVTCFFEICSAVC